MRLIWGEWTKVRPFFNAKLPTDGKCEVCGKLSCAPGWLSIKRKAFRCKSCLDAPEAAHDR